VLQSTPLHPQARKAIAIGSAVNGRDLDPMRETTAVAIRRCVLGIIVSALAAFVAAEEPPQTRFEAARVVAFGDVHGAFDALTELLIQAEVIDTELRWQGGTTHLVSLGDLVDRGPDSRKVMDMLRRLQDEALAAGGRVHLVLGNHEVMMLTGDLRYVSPGEYAAFAGPDSRGDDRHPPGFAELTAAFAPDGTYGEWLLAQPAVVIVNDTAFVHGGLSPLAAQHTPEQINATVQARLRELLAVRTRLEEDGVLERYRETTEMAAELRARLAGQSGAAIDKEHRAAAARFIELAEDPLLGEEGPLWYRGTAACHAMLETPLLDQVLTDWRVQRVIVGHTPTADSRVRSRLEDRALLADTGMLAEYYRGRASAVIIDGDGPTVIYAGDPEATTPDPDPGTLLHPLSESDVLAALANSEVSLRPDLPTRQGQAVELHDFVHSATVRAWFEPLPGKQIDSAIAAFRLDRLLGLNLAAPVVRRTVNGTDGTLTALWAGAITEGERAERDLLPLNGCSAGSNALLLLYAFDGLIQNQGRTNENIHYDRRTWRLASSGHHDSFGRGRSLPAYLARTPRRIPESLAQALRTLDESALATALGEDIGGAQLRSLLTRRDLMLKTWTIGD
jgi:hypothetical protein